MSTSIIVFLAILVTAIIAGLATGFIRNRIPFKTWLRLVWEDHCMIFTSEGRAEIKRSAHHLHYICTLLIVLGTMVLATAIDMYFQSDYAQVNRLGLIGSAIVGYVAGLFGNFVREWYYSEFKGKDWEFRDIRFGGYGGRDGAIIGFLIVSAMI